MAFIFKRGRRTDYRPLVNAGGAPLSVTGYALTKSLAPTTNFNGISGPLIYDATTTEETRLWIAVQNADAEFNGLVVNLLPTFQMDNITGVPDGSGDWGGPIKCGTIITGFDVTTMTWNTQPDITDASQMEPGLVPVSNPFQTGSNTTGCSGTAPAFVIGNQNATGITGFVFLFDSTSGVTGRVVVDNFSNIGFLQVTVIN